MTNLWRSAGNVVRSATIGLALSGMAMSQALAVPIFSPDPASVTAGDTVTVTLNDSLDPAGIAAFDLQVTFDPTLLIFQSAALGSLLPAGGWNLVAPSSTTGTATISIAELCLPCIDATGSGSVITLTFGAISTDPTGPTTISAVSTSAAPATYQLSTTSGTINIAAAIPAPGLPLFALPVLFLIRRFKRRA